ASSISTGRRRPHPSRRAPEMAGSFDVLRQRNFAMFWGAAAISNAGSWMQIVALPEIVFRITGKATSLGTAAVAGVVPTIVLTPLFGALADRFSRRMLLLVSQTLLMVVSLVLWILYTSGQLTVGRIIILNVITGAANGMNFPVWTSLVPLLVAREHLISAVRLNSLQYTVGRVFGPVSAGVVIAAWGPGAAILINAVTFVMVLIALVFIRPRAAGNVAVSTSVWTSVVEGARFVWHHWPLRVVCLMIFLNGVFAMSFTQLAPAVAEGAYGKSGKFNAVLLMAMGIGAATSSFIIVTRGDRFRHSTLVTGSFLGVGVAIALMASATTAVVGVIGYFLLGLFQVATNISVNSAMQTLAPDHMRGRVVSMYMTAVMTAGPLGTLVIGALADVQTMRVALLITSAAVAAIVAVLHTTGVLANLDAPHLGLPADVIANGSA
ncbi:MAG: MFS transporter, partial [Acidimicrobiia bacterium]